LEKRFMSSETWIFASSITPPSICLIAANCPFLVANEM
jgi:hypothetical protein